MDREVENLSQKFLEAKGLTADSATAAELSDAEAYESSYNWYINYMKVQPNTADMASKIWLQKYALHNKEGICLEKTPADMWDRVAGALTDEEFLTNPDLTVSRKEVFTNFRSILDGFKYTPQGSGLFALGNPYVNSSASNCFVLPSPEDSLDSIFETAKLMAKIYAFRGGIGIDVSNLRPYGASTNNAARSSTGAASFMDFYSYVTGMIGQQGRRGALMLTMRVDHPDIMRFIEMKRDMDKKPFFEELAAAGVNINDSKWSAMADRLKSTSFANVSVRISDAFMQAVKDDADFELYFDYEDPNKPRYSEIVKARVIWDKLMHSAWESAEPGILNWDHILRESPADQYINLTDIEYTDPKTNERKNTSYSFRTLSTNPCGEVPLSGGDSCCLGTFYLPAFITGAWTPEAAFNFDLYEKHIRTGVRAQDNIKNWDSRILPLEINRVSAILGRRISLGNHGLADCLASLGLKYDSKEAQIQTDKIYEFLKNTAYDESANLAAEKGMFQVFDADKHFKSPFIQRLSPSVKKKIKKNGLRNIALLTNAPTGSMSVLSRNCSSGIEPIFLKSYTRNVKIPGTNDFEKYTVYHQAIQDCIDAGGNLDVFIEAGNIDPAQRIELQATIQSHIDHAISVTTNLKSDATVENIDFLYRTAFEKGCKGFTVYRDGCRTGVLNAIKVEKPHKIMERPKTTNIDIHKVKYRDKQWAVLVGFADNGPIEVFAGIEEDTPLPNKYHRAELTKKSRGHYSLTVFLSEDEDDIIRINNIGARFPLPEGMTLTRFISLALKNGVSVSDICEQLTKSSNSMFDYPAVLNRVLKSYITAEEYGKNAGDKPCPECGKSLKFRKQDGCMVEFCEHCNYLNSKCG